MLQLSIAVGLLTLCIGGLIWIATTEEFKDMVVYLKFRFFGLRGIVSERDYFVDVEPSQLKTVEFLQGGIEGRLVFFGPFNRNVRRVLLLWKNQKHRHIRMDDVHDIKAERMDELVLSSVIEAREIAIKVFQKRNAKSSQAKKQVPSQLKETRVEQAPPMQEIEVVRAYPKPVDAPSKPATNLLQVAKADVPVIKGFKAQYVGKMVAAKVESHIKTAQNGSPEEYASYTLTLDTEDGVERLVGNDLKRAIVAANVDEGDMVRVLYLRDLDLPSGFKKKSYQIINLSKQKDWKG